MSFADGIHGGDICRLQCEGVMNRLLIEFNILTTESIANKIYNGINLSGVNIQ